MSYRDIAELANDENLRRRILACAVQEGVEDVDAWVSQNLITIAAQPGWDAAWGSAREARRYPIGDDPGVITDGMILSAVQALNNPGPQE